MRHSSTTPPGLFKGCCVFLLLLPVLGCPSRIIYHPDKQIVAPVKGSGLVVETVRLKTADNIAISGWWVPSVKQRAVVLFCHGNAGNRSHRIDYLKLFRGLEFSTFIFDYRGFGESGGSPSEQGTYRDVQAAWQYLVVQRQIPPARIIVYGRSLGGPVAAWAARQNTPGMLVLDSTFTALTDLIRERLTWITALLFAGYPYPTKEHLEFVACPVLVIHSPGDDVIPYAHGRQLHALAKGQKEFLETAGSHNTALDQASHRYASGLENAFLRFMMPKKAGTESPETEINVN